MKPLTVGSLFSGVGGFDKAFKDEGFDISFQVEIDKNCLNVLEKHFPGVPKFKDVKDVGKHNLRTVDVLCGGFPCQGNSVAGERAGLGDERTGLWFEFLRIIRELKPRWVVVENVVGLLSVNSGRDFATILRGLSESGYDAEWDCVSASLFGAPHERTRLFIVAYPISTRLSRPFFEGILCYPESKASTEFGNRNIACGSWWLENSANIRMGDGIPLRVARPIVKMAGNSLVPQVAQFIVKRILELD